MLPEVGSIKNCHAVTELLQRLYKPIYRVILALPIEHIEAECLFFRISKF